MLPDKRALLVLFLLGAVGCATSSSSRSEEALPATTNSPTSIERTLRDAVSDWDDTPHILGGASQAGADCSGFVMRVFDNRFGLALPRSTQLQVEAGIEIGQSDLRAGDLVLFQTGAKTRHVGIYLANDEFAHVSSSRGVTISNMTTRYWQDAYWTARRVMHLTETNTPDSSPDESSATSQSTPFGW